MQPSGFDAPKATALVSVGHSVKYEIQWGPLAEYILSSRNTTLQQVLDAQRKNEPRFFALAMELLSAMTAHRYPAGEQIKPAEFAARIESSQFGPMWKAIWDTLIEAKAIVVNAPAKNEQTPEPIPATIQLPS